METVHRYLVVMQRRPVGVMSTVERGAAERETWFQYRDRGRGPSLRLDWTVRPDGLPVRLSVRGDDEDGNPVEERFTREETLARWTSPIDQGTSGEPGAFYVPASPVPEVLAALVRALRQAPQGRLPLLPAGEARLEVLDTLELGQQVTLYAVHGLQFGPSLVWLDAQGVFFASGAPYLAVVRRDHEEVLPQLFAAQARVLAQRERQRAQALWKVPPGPIFVRDVRVVDVRTGTAREKMAVALRGGWIVWIGPDREARPPPDAVVVQAAGRTLVPGLWDLHSHPESMGELLHLAAGVVAIRDLGSDANEAQARRRATLAHTLLGPRVFLGGLIDGEGSLTAPGGVVVRDEAEAARAVDQFATAGFDSVKLYNSVPPSLVPAIAARAHQRGLRLSGHVPQGMTAAQAARAGMDELHHAYFLFPSLFARQLEDHPQPMQVLLREAPWLPLDGPQVRELIHLLREEEVAVDPTLALCESMYVGRQGAPSAALSEVLPRLPPLVRRRVLASGVATVEKEEARRLKSYLQATVRLTGALYRGGVKVLAGSDGMAGFTLLRELELLQQAGLQPSEVLKVATLDAAEWMGRGQELGSIEVGKRGDLLLVEGDPLADISALRGAALVFYEGALLDPAALYRELSIQPAAGQPVSNPPVSTQPVSTQPVSNPPGEGILPAGRGDGPSLGRDGAIPGVDAGGR